MDSYNYFCNKHDEDNVKTEKALESFLDSIDSEVSELKDIIFELEQQAKDYEGYDFREELRDYLMEVL